MKLPTEFIRLPLRFDAAQLALEVLAFEESDWKPHPQGYPGNSALSLVAVEGDPRNDATAGPMRPTAFLARAPYLRQVLAALGAPIGRTRLMRLDGNAEATPHADTNYYWAERVRVHVPIVTTPRVDFLCGARRVHMAPGEAWIFDTWRIHNVLNPEPTRRIHLVSDTVGSPAFWELVENGERPFEDPPRASAPDLAVPYRADVEIDLQTETRNQPVVMTPWEQIALRDRLLAELEEIAAEARETGAGRDTTEALAGLRAELFAFERRWRALWSRHGDDAAGFAAYRALLDETGRRWSPFERRLRLRNGIDAVEVLRHWLLRPALNPQLASGSARGSVDPSTPALSVSNPEVRSGAPRRFSRPIFLVCPPRSGSSLLFETLTQSPDLWTIGGESHAIFEEIPALQPARRGWESNRLTAEDARPEVVERLTDGLFVSLKDRDGRRPAAGAEDLRLLEKTPKNALRVPFLATAFPDALFVYLYRNPRETIHSIHEAWRSGRFVTYPALPGWSGPAWSLALIPGWRELAGRPLPEIAARQWQAITEQLLADLGALPAEQWCVANYGALVSRPQEEIERLCHFLGCGWDRALTAPLPASRHTLSPPEAGKWRKSAHLLSPVLPLVAGTAERALDVFAQRPGHAPLAPADLEEAEEMARASGPPSATPAAESEALEAAPLLASPRSQPAPAPGGGTPLELPMATPGDESIAPRSRSSSTSSAMRSVHTTSLVQILDSLRSSLVLTTYQSGRVVVVRADGPQLNTHFCAYPSPMGLAVGPRYLALGTQHQVWELRNVPAAAARVPPPGRHDACFLPRRQHFTGDVRIHEMAFAGDELWLVNTRFSCLSSLDADHSFVPRWRPPFISALAAEDRCHLNGLCIGDGRPRYATALGTTDTPQGWRERKADGGALLDVESGEPVATGLSMPHSPRLYQGRLWLLESGKGEVNTVDPATGRVDVVARLPGFTRGLAFAGPFAFVGLSQVRESVFGGIPLAERTRERLCGIWALDLRTGNVAGFLRFEDAVQEIFDVQILRGLRFPHLAEPSGELLETTFVIPSEALAEVAPAKI